MGRKLFSRIAGAGIVTAAFTLLTALPAAAEVIGGQDFPQGTASFADQVVSFTLGENTVSPYDDPAEALGAPDYDSADAGYVSLGWGGTLIVRFTDNSLTTSGNSNLDLWIFEIGAAVEPTWLYISQNGADWISIGGVGGATAGIDIDAYIGAGGVTAGARYSYVKLVDQNVRKSGYPYAGADIDAIGAISSAPPVQDPDGSVPVPGTLALLGLGLLSVSALGRRHRLNAQAARRQAS